MKNRLVTGSLIRIPLILAMTFSIANAQVVDNLQAFEWSNRLIVIKAPSDKVDTLKSKLIDNDADIEQRHLLWFILTERGIHSNFDGSFSADLHSNLSRQWFSQQKSPIKVILIGKDGMEKWRHSSLDLDAIFAEIDVMPMRQQEMMGQ